MGAYGQVRACTDRETDRHCAVKLVDLDGSREQKREAKKEGLIWKRVGCHPHVVRLFETYSDHDFSYFVMERCEYSLFDKLLTQDGLRGFDLLNIFRQMLLGLEHCHSMAVVHRDVKPANFLVAVDGVVKLCDFGLAELEGRRGITGLAGTAPFMSPEMVLEKPYGQKTDIWSLGATAYLMLYGAFPYQIKTRRGTMCESMQHAIATNSQGPDYMAAKGLAEPSLFARCFVKVLLHREPSQRPSATECLQLKAMRLTDEVPIQASTIRLAKQKTAELKTIVDPTVAKSRDALIKQLQNQFRGSFAQPVPRCTSSFSLPNLGEKSMASTCSSRFSRSISDGGVLSISTLHLTMSAELSECSTSANSMESAASTKISL